MLPVETPAVRSLLVKSHHARGKLWAVGVSYGPLVQDMGRWCKQWAVGASNGSLVQDMGRWCKLWAVGASCGSLV